MKCKLFMAIFVASTLISGLISQSCSKITNLVAQTISWKGIDASATIPIITDMQYHASMGTGSFTYNLDSMIKAETKNTLSLSNISKVTLTKCVLTITNPDNENNFANFKSCDMNFWTNKNPTHAHIATIADNPDTYAETLELPVDKTIDLKSYLYSPVNTSNTTTFTYDVSGQLRRATTKPIDATVHLEYNIAVGGN